MALQSPGTFDTLRRRGVTPFVSDDDNPDIVAPPRPKSAGTVAGDATRAAGTVVGQLARQGVRAGTNLAIQGSNALAAGETRGINTLTYPYRVAGGFVRDFTRAAAGVPESQNAGQPIAALKAPSIGVIDWNKVDTAQTPAATPANDIAGSTTAAPAAPRPVLLNPSLQNGVLSSDMPGTFRAGKATTTTPAGSIPVAANIRPAIDTGVTLPDGRKLPYGAMVNGVPTFSDGSGGPGAPPRTMTDAEIKGLGDRLNIVPATAFTRPAPTFNSDNTDQNVANIIASRQGGKFGVTPEMTANANLAAVVNQDPRSTLGRAALNAARRASGATTVLQRKAALDDQAALRDAVTRSGLAGVDNAAAQGRTNTDAAATLQRQGMANAGALQQRALQNEGELARTDLAGQYGVAQTLASPKKAGEMTPKDYMTQLNTGVQAQIKNYNDQQALLPPDQRQPLTDAAIAEMRSIQAKALGLRVGTDANGRRVVQINGQVVPL